jgi:hypothetical protein
MFNDYVCWSLQTSLMMLILSLTAIFFVLTTVWAVLIAGVGWYQPQCLYVGTKTFEEAGSYFIDAYAISWTTFSTVVRCFINLYTYIYIYIYLHSNDGPRKWKRWNAEHCLLIHHICCYCFSTLFDCVRAMA